MQRSNLLALAAVVLFLIVVIAQPVEFHLTNLTFSDDGFYYLGYARNIALGNGPTFDGIVETNGVQPLWALLLAGLGLITTDPLGLMRASLVLAVILAVISCLAMNDILRHFFNPELRRVTLLFFIAFVATPPIILNGMETPVNLAAFVLAIAAVLRIKRPAFWPTVGGGILVGITCLGRVDNLILTPAFALLLLYGNGQLSTLRERTGLRDAVLSVVWLAVPVIVIFGGYLAFNQAVFGHLLPISGDIKGALQSRVAESMGGRFSLDYLATTTRDSAEATLFILNNYLTMPLLSFSATSLIARQVLAVGLVVMAVVIVLRFRSRPKASTKITVTWSSLLVAGLVGANVFAHTWIMFFQIGERVAGVLNWYYVPEYAFLTLLIGYVLQVVARMLRSEQGFYKVATVWLVVSLAISAVVFSRQFQTVESVTPLVTHYEATLWANQNVAPNAVIGSFNSGVIGYFSDTPVINLDGLMNDEEILQVVKGEATIWDYVQRHNIGWIMDFTPLSWQGENQTDFRGIPLENLRLHYTRAFENYGRVPSEYYVYQVTTGDS